MVYDDLRIALERRKRLMADGQQEYQVDMQEWCIGEGCYMIVPVQAIEIDDNVLRKKYINDCDDIVAKRMPENETEFSMQFYPHPQCTIKEAEQMRDSVKQMIMRLQPANTFYSQGTEETIKNTSCWFDFDSFGLDGKIYNFLFFTPLIFLGKIAIGGFHCKEQLAVTWKPIFIQMMRSLKEWGGKDEE